MRPPAIGQSHSPDFGVQDQIKREVEWLASNGYIQLQVEAQDVDPSSDQEPAMEVNTAQVPVEGSEVEFEVLDANLRHGSDASADAHSIPDPSQIREHQCPLVFVRCIQRGVEIKLVNIHVCQEIDAVRLDGSVGVIDWKIC